MKTRRKQGGTTMSPTGMGPIPLSNSTKGGAIPFCRLNMCPVAYLTTLYQLRNNVMSDYTLTTLCQLQTI